MMDDPPRLRSNSGSVEALLLQSSRNGEPPPDVEEEVWRRVQLITAAGTAVGAAGLAAQTAAAGSNMVKGALWLSVLKWTAVVAVVVPTAGVVGHWAIRREAAPAASSAGVTTASGVPRALDVGRVPPESSSVPDVVPADIPAATLAPDAPTPEIPAPRIHPASGTVPAQDAPSALRKESLSLGAARAQFAAGNPRSALDSVARLGVEFPHGRLLQEREMLAIDCLAALGDSAGARTRARAFLDRFPASPYLAHVRQILAR
jgi:hypothetical protein